MSASERICDRKGFTLIEVILAVVLLGIIGVALTSAFVPTLTASVNVDNRKEAFQQGGLAVERMMGEIRQARAISSITNAPGATTLTFVDATNKTIEYSWGGAPANPLQRSRDDLPCCTLVDLACCVQSLAMTYFDKAGNPTTIPLNVWRAQADVQVSVNGQTIQLNAEAHPRGFF